MGTMLTVGGCSEEAPKPYNATNGCHSGMYLAVVAAQNR